MNQSHLTQIEKYNGEEGYKAEMRRRRALGSARPLTSEQAKAMALKRWSKKRAEEYNHNREDSDNLPTQEKS